MCEVVRLHRATVCADCKQWKHREEACDGFITIPKEQISGNKKVERETQKDQMLRQQGIVGKPMAT